MLTLSKNCLQFLRTKFQKLRTLYALSYLNAPVTKHQRRIFWDIICCELFLRKVPHMELLTASDNIVIKAHTSAGVAIIKSIKTYTVWYRAGTFHETDEYILVGHCKFYHM